MLGKPRLNSENLSSEFQTTIKSSNVDCWMNGEQISFHWRRSRPEVGYELGVIWEMSANNDRSLAQVFRAI
jgi:hypothetical protein